MQPGPGIHEAQTGDGRHDAGFECIKYSLIDRWAVRRVVRLDFYLADKGQKPSARGVPVAAIRNLKQHRQDSRDFNANG